MRVLSLGVKQGASDIVIKAGNKSISCPKLRQTEINWCLLTTILHCLLVISHRYRVWGI